MVRRGRLLPVAVAAGLFCSMAHAAPAYRLAATIPLGAPDRWDYVVPDPEGGRVYIAHGDRLSVLNARSGAVIGAVAGIPGGTHGTAISAATAQGFTDDGRNGLLVAFDLPTLKVIRTIPAAADADAIVSDPLTGRILVVEGDPGTITVVDARTDAPVATITGGEKMEYAAADGEGAVYVAGEEKSDLLKIDAGAARIVRRWPVPGCTSPHGLAYDHRGRRLFMGCVNAVMIVIDARDGRIVATLPIGRGSDAVAFDPVRRRVFSANGADGTVSIYQQRTPDRYEALETVRSAVSGRTMGVDPTTGRLFVAAADTQPNPTPGGRPRVVPGSLHVLMFEPLP